MGKIVIHDTADVTITDLATGKVVLNAEAQLAQVTGAISEEDLKGGIGNRKLYKIRTDKEVNLTMRSAVADVEYWAMTQGVAVDHAGVAVVTEKATGKVAGKEIVIADADALLGATAKVEIDGIQTELPTIASTTEPTKQAIDLATLTPVLTEGTNVSYFYSKEVTGKQIKIDSNNFAGKYKVEYKTIAYDLETAQVTSDIYFIFPETIPAGEFDISLESGSVYTPEISFSVMNPIGSSEMGQIMEVART